MIFMRLTVSTTGGMLESGGTPRIWKKAAGAGKEPGKGNHSAAESPALSLHMGQGVNNAVTERMFSTLWQPGSSTAGIVTHGVVERQLAEKHLTAARRRACSSSVEAAAPIVGQPALAPLKTIAASPWTRACYLGPASREGSSDN